MADGASGSAVVPNETLYIQNLNERVQLPSAYMWLTPVMKQSLEALFSTFGPVLSIVAHKNLRMRGQAFVSFPDKETASRAMKEVSGFPLYGKSMVRASNLCSACRMREHPPTVLWRTTVVHLGHPRLSRP